jgi:hypothetical protein
MRSYPSWIAGLRYRASDGTERGRYCARYLTPGTILGLEPEPDNPVDCNAVKFTHRGHSVGYVPMKHGWVCEALEDDQKLSCSVTRVETDGWIFRRASFVAVRIYVKDDEQASRLIVHFEAPALDPAAEAVRRNKEVRAREACINGMRVLAYLALADDRLTDEELNIEQSYIEARLASLGFEHDAALAESIFAIGQGLVVPIRSLVRAVNAVAEDETNFRLVWRVANDLASIGSSGKIAAEALDRLRVVGRSKGYL